MWSLRRSFKDKSDSYLVQSFVGETRVLGVVSASAMDEDEDGSEGEGEDEREDDGVGKGKRI